MSGKRIAFVDLLFHWPPTGGSWVDLKEIATRLKYRGFDIRLFVPEFTTFFQRGVIKEPLGIEIETIPFHARSFHPRNLSNEMMKRMREYKPDYVFLGDGYFMKPHMAHAMLNEYPVIMRFYSHEIFCPRVNMIKLPTMTICNNTILKDKRQCFRCFFATASILSIWRFLNNGLHDNVHLHFLHEYIVAQAYLSKYKNIFLESLNGCKNIIVYNSYIYDMVSPYNSRVNIITSGIDSEKFHLANNFNQNKKIIIMSGRVDDPVKGLSVLRRAVRVLERKRNDFEVIVTSASKWQDGSIRSVGWLNQAELPGLYRQGYCAVIPVVWREPFGITTVEAMASGLPVIASSLGGPGEVVEDGKTGILVPPGDSDLLAQAISQLLDDPVMAREMGLRGRERACTLYDWDVIVDKHYVRMFQNI